MSESSANPLLIESLEQLLHGRFEAAAEALGRAEAAGLDAALAEALGMVTVKMEAREVRMQQTIEELRAAKAKLARENRQLRAALGSSARETLPMSQSRAMGGILRVAERVAPTDAPVLILGESGTGKEVLARWIHEASQRQAGPFVALNCAALPESLLEAELFGIDRGTATGVDARAGKFEAAQGGTLFLDEIGDMTLSTQARILRVLQEREVTRLGSNTPKHVDFRLLAATHQDLTGMVAKGGFRQDLYYRLAIITVTLPGLRERPDDILPLARFFARSLGPNLGHSSVFLGPDAEAALIAHRWPGNIRELRNVMERALLMSDDGVIRAGHLGLDPRLPGTPASAFSSPTTSLRLRPSNPDERRAIEDALTQCRGRRGKAAEMLGINRETLRLKMKKHGLMDR